VLDKVHEISSVTVDDTHVFTLSQVYEGLLLKMGEKGNDGGQFFTPRQVIKAMVQVIAPRVDETVYDPGCGTGGFLALSFEHMAGPNNEKVQTAEQLETLKQRTFWGREKENLIYPVALANLVLHGIDKPSLWHGNTLTHQEVYGGLFAGAGPDAAGKRARRGISVTNRSETEAPMSSVGALNGMMATLATSHGTGAT
jgi:type I restriction enzyme M protein